MPVANRPDKPDTDELLRRSRNGDKEARDSLLAGHQSRLLKMVTARIDKRLAARLDSSDVVQEVMKVAHRRLSEYLKNPRQPFYLWLRGIAMDRLVELYRRHVVAAKRSVLREQPQRALINDESEHELANRLVTSSFHPGRRLLLEEMLARVRNGLHELSENDREILVLRHLEQLSVEEIAAVLAISKSAVTTRHLRALQRLRDVLGDESVN
jgi:RNA polymerase sigma-70 factor, ECF subfamily